MKRISSLLSIALFSLFTYPLFAQVNIADSLALVDFYIATNGPGWDLDNNWLTADSVDDWLGITVSDIQGTDRVTAINIQGNNLQGELPQSLGNLEFLSTLNLFGNQIVSFPEIVGLNPIVIDLGSNALTALPSFTGYTNTATLLVDGNQLTNLPDLLNLPSLQTFWVQNNNLTFVDLFQGNQFQLPDYQYAPQNPFSAQTQYFKDGASYDICNFFPDIATGNQYQWFDESGNPLTGVSPSTCLTLEIFGADLTGTYVQVVTNPNLPDLTLIGTLDIVVLFEEEPGACYNPLEFIVQFVPGASEDNIANLEAVLTAEGATKIKECLCGDVLQLWTAPTVTEVEGRKGSAEDQLDVDTTGNNYSLFIILSQETGGTENVWSPPNFDGSPDPNVKVGVIDTGIGPDIEDTAPVIWTNEQELVSPGLDDDGNCLIDEIEGYDFQNSTNVVVDGSIHGSHVSGIVANDFPADVDLDIMDLRVHDGETGFLFDAACAIYFAVQNEAKVINNSWGYYASTISPVLDVALQEAIVNDVVMVCSAGNGLEGTMVDTDIMPHWPSSAEYPNIISVAALDNFTDVGAQLASYSNFGFTSVDIAAEGTDIESTVPFNNLATFSGTSMAAAQVTRTAAIIRGRDSDYSAQDVVDCILSTAEFSPDLAGQIFTEGFLNTDAALLACFPVSTVQVNFGDLEVLPNPFSEYVGIRLPADAIQEDVQFTVFDAKGALVYQQQYSYTSILMWDGISQSGAPVPAGFYLYHLMIGDTIYTGKLIRNP